MGGPFNTYFILYLEFVTISDVQLSRFMRHSFVTEGQQWSRFIR